MYKIVGGDGNEYGPISADGLRQWIREGRANVHSQVLPEGGTAWVALGQVAEFSALFNVAPSPAVFTATPVSRQMNPLALTGFILSIVSITVGLCCCSGLPFSISGIVCSAIGLVQIRAQPERYSGKGLAIAGIIVGAVSILLGVLLFILFGVLDWQEIQKELEKH